MAKSVEDFLGTLKAPTKRDPPQQPEPDPVDAPTDDDEGLEIIPFDLKRRLETARRVLTRPAYLEDPSLQRRHFIEFARAAYQVPQFPTGLVTELFGRLAEGLNISEAALVEAREPKANGHDPDPLGIDLSKFDPPPTANGKQQKPHQPAAMSVEEWLRRQFEELDCILGDWLTTTSRVLLTAPTGLGKTMFVFGLAMGAGAARGFLCWRGRRISRVLIIDGEMSRRLLKKRIAGEVARLNAPLTSIYFLSHEDVENFAPLNTPEGQKYIDQEIERLGGVDLIVFDNIMSLLSGDPKENEPWRKTLPWVKSLTKRNIAQIWVHHTGHDEGRGYGDKAREWQMDTTIHLERVERPDTDVSFDLQFRKAREREPETRADFEDFRIALVDDQWIWERTKGGGHKGKVSPMAGKFLAALKAAIAADGGRFGKQSVTLDAWRVTCGNRSLLDEDIKSKNSTSLFNKYRRELIAADHIVCNETEAWITP